MVYLLETKLLENKSLVFALNKVYGLGNSKSKKICKSLGFSINLKVISLTKDQVSKLIRFIENSDNLVSSDLKKHKFMVLKKLTNLKLYRGLRRFNGLPVRGQRTHTNSKNSKKFKVISF